MSDLRQCYRQLMGEFIGLYRSFPGLWQVKCADYSDRNKKNHAYDILIEKLSYLLTRKRLQRKSTLRTIIKKK